MSGASSGDNELFGQLYSRIAPALHAWASLRIPTKIRAIFAPEDVVQEVWCRAATRFPEYDPARGPFRGWIFGFARKVLLEGFKAVHRSRTHRSGSQATSRVFVADAVPDQATSVSLRVARDDQLRVFLEHVAELGEQDRELVVLRGLEGLTHEEVAVHLGLSSENVRKRWERLRRRLAEDTTALELLEEA